MGNSKSQEKNSSLVSRKQFLETIQLIDERIIPIDKKTPQNLLEKCYNTFASSFNGDTSHLPELTWHWILGPENENQKSQNRLDLLNYYGKWLITWSIKYAYTYAIQDPDTSEIAGIASFVPPGVIKDGELDTLSRSLYVISKIGDPLDHKYPSKYPGVKKRINQCQQGLREMRKQLQDNDYWYLYSVSVSPKYQGKGYGKALVNLFNSICDQEGQIGFLDCTGYTSIEIFTRCGFQQIKDYDINIEGNTSMDTYGQPTALMYREPKSKNSINSNDEI